MNRPQKITYHKKSRLLEVDFGDHKAELPAEILRAYSPSAEVRGHSASERRLQTGKKYVAITQIEPVGNYAVRLTFDDGHDSGLYGWDLLEDLGVNLERYWRDYLAELKAANASRLPTIPVGHWNPRG
ncbi:MAG: gamma-butyrobetaine hydroxylase-like domain-containing protein [Pseudomonadales bacterium]